MFDMTSNCNLTLKTFPENVLSIFKQVYEEGKFSDVTLICDDQLQFKAHRFVLSSCSPVFKQILEGSPSQHPLIYLRGIQSPELESILEFMYLGEGKIPVERMTEFIRVAKDLNVKEISDSLEFVQIGKEEIIADNLKDDLTEETAVSDEGSAEDTVGTILDDDTTDTEDREETEMNQVFTHKESKIEETLDKTKKVNYSQSKPWQCSVCGGMFLRRSALITHMESVHEGIKYPCDQCDHHASNKSSLYEHIRCMHGDPRYFCHLCGFKTARKQGLKNHILIKHEGIRYPCTKCDYQATTKSCLKKHIQCKHEGVRYPCNQCDYKATGQHHLRTHVQSVHSGVKYPCDQCDYQASHRSHLTSHLLSKHEGVRYPCDLCENKFTSTGTLTRHIRTVHEGLKYSCNQCDYKASANHILQVHIKEKHEGLNIKTKYPCDECDYLGSSKYSLTMHVKSKHRGERNFACDQCDYKAANPSTLKTHIQGMHKNIILKCEDCGYQTRWSPEFSSHRKTHTATMT